MSTVTVTRTYLRLDAPSKLRAFEVMDPAVSVERTTLSAPAYRELYTLVGHDYHWRDRLAWSDEELSAYLERPDISVWVLTVDGRTAGYFELKQEPDDVEIVYFGIARAFHGRGLGKHLLTSAVRTAFATGAKSVWLHTCTLDDPAALPNYKARGFEPFREEQYQTEI